MEGAVWRIIFRREFLIDNNLLFNTAIKFSEDNLFMMAALSHCQKMLATDTVCHHYVQHGENMTLTVDNTDWRKTCERDISRGKEIMKLYLSDKSFLDNHKLNNVFEFNAYEYAFNAINQALLGCADFKEIDEIISQLENTGIYPLKPLKTYKEYQLSRQPLALLKWYAFNNRNSLKILTYLTRYFRKLK